MSQRRPPGTKPSKNSRIWEQVNENAAGVDAGAEHHYVCVPEQEGRPSVRKFETNTRGLLEARDWLLECGVTTVAIEATGVFCMPLLEVLDQAEIEVVLIKPGALKSVNDRRKSDMIDCQWIQYLHSLGMFRKSFRPEKEMVAYRSYNRQRQMLVQHASTAIEHMKKALTLMNVRVDQAVSDVTGETGMRIIRAILRGERNPRVLAELRDDRCEKSVAAIAEDLTGKYTDHDLFALRQAVDRWDHIRGQILECDVALEKVATGLEKKGSAVDLPKARRIEHTRKNVFTFDARGLFFEVLGQDLTQIPGVSTGTISVFLAEVGVTVDKFETEKNFASWLRACPGSNKSGGKNRSSKNKKTTNRLWVALKIAAQTLNKSQTALGAFYRRKRAHLGPQAAVAVTAHKLARMIYFTIKHQRVYIDPGPDAYLEQFRDRMLKKMEKQARKLGYTLTKAA
jgi:transposase